MDAYTRNDILSRVVTFPWLSKLTLDDVLSRHNSIILFDPYNPIIVTPEQIQFRDILANCLSRTWETFPKYAEPYRDLLHDVMPELVRPPQRLNPRIVVPGEPLKDSGKGPMIKIVLKLAK